MRAADPQLPAVRTPLLNTNDAQDSVTVNTMATESTGHDMSTMTDGPLDPSVNDHLPTPRRPQRLSATQAR